MVTVFYNLPVRLRKGSEKVNIIVEVTELRSVYRVKRRKDVFVHFASR